MAYGSGLRYFPLLGSVINLVAFIIALKLLLVSIAGRSGMENAAIVTVSRLADSLPLPQQLSPASTATNIDMPPSPPPVQHLSSWPKSISLLI